MYFRKKARQEGMRDCTPTQLAATPDQRLQGPMGGVCEDAGEALALETRVWGGALEVRCGVKTFQLMMLIQKPKLTRVLSEALAAKGPRKDDYHPGHFIKCTVTSSEKVSPSSMILEQRQRL